MKNLEGDENSDVHAGNVLPLPQRATRDTWHTGCTTPLIRLYHRTIAS
jgi:hypothetical protein